MGRDTVRRVNIRDYTREQVTTWAPDEVDPARWATLADRFTVVAECQGEPVGFVDLEPDGHVDRFFVHADRQRLGIGRAMLAAVVAEAERRGLDRLHAAVSITARPFFESQGFVVLAHQEVVRGGVTFRNSRMERRLDRREDASPAGVSPKS